MEHFSSDDGRKITAQPPPIVDGTEAKVYSTGAFRSSSVDKIDYDGILSPYALEAWSRYLLWCSYLDNGDRRTSDNWQKGMSLIDYRKSLWRHLVDVWRILRGYPPQTKETNLVWACAATLFNINGILHEAIKADPDLIDKCEKQMTKMRNERWGCEYDGQNAICGGFLEDKK